MNTKGKQTTRDTMAGALRAFGAVALLTLTISGINQSALAQDHSGHTRGQEMKVPQTAQEHHERAAQYRKAAEEQRQEVRAHKKMLADYSKTVAKNPKDTGENSYVKKMRLHCENYIKAAEALAQEADEMAKYHTMRGKEMEGK
jgi:hypothetical protein